ncbi:MAG: malonyl-CoA/methylmalonyl-CoA synthetase [Solirubrobacteraceae bacterium]|nr:malonyl-CoA/methylmalonyl-CoA synthetase [Solirubrobacteraceae bacterium]
MTDRTATDAVRDRALSAWRLHAGRDVGVAGDELRAELTAGSLPAAFHETATAHGDRPALEIDGTAATHGELDAAVAGVARRLRDRGAEPGGAVAVCAPTSMALVAAYLGALRSGATVVLANPAYTERELRHIVGDSGASVAVGAGPGAGHLGRIAAERDGGLDVVELDALVAGAGAEPGLPVPPLSAGDVALLAYTSGTTGTPKTVPLTHGNLLSSIRGAMLAWRWSADDVLVHALPLFHQHGLGGVHATLLAGSRAVIASRFDPARLLETVAAAPASVLFAVPAIYERLLAGGDGSALRTPRLLVSGSAPLSPALSERIAAVAGRAPLERYGTTESGLDVSHAYDGDRRAGTVGVPLPGVELAVADADGRPVADGEDGEILLRGPQVFAGYRGAAEAGAAAFHPGGWFRTGDIGRLDPADGVLQITGRSKELIITGGMNVYPREVALVLERAPGVERAAVVGVPSERWGEEVVAVVVASGGAAVDADAVIAHARAELAPYKCPKRVVVVDELPANAMGKVVTSEVVRMATAAGEGR